MIKVYFQPQSHQWPERGGVKTHLLQLYKQLDQHVQLVRIPEDADIIHLESSYPLPKLSIIPSHRPKIVYVCHGGFVPPLPVVMNNLHRADKIVSVAQWMVDKYFKPEWKEKTVVIPNGVDFQDFKNLPNNSLEPGYILYAKEKPYYFEDFYNLVYRKPDWNFVTTVWPTHEPLPFNVKCAGLFSTDQMKSVLAKAGCLLLTGSEVCPTMLFEAWAMGVPVVGKNIDGNKEFIGPCSPGSLYTGDLIPVLEQNLSNRRIIGQRGYAEVVEKYQWKDLVKKYVEVYEEILS